MAHDRLPEALEKCTRALLDRCGPHGHWTGRLSSSALSTATAVTALALVDRASPQPRHTSPIERGLAWLAGHANLDGGWGDTPLSLSNISTTTLCWAAFGAVPSAERTYASVVGRAEEWLSDRTGIASFEDPGSRSALARAIIARYGKDRTFSVPILTMCALAGRLGCGREAWDHVLPLPFELAACPRQWFAALRLPVVSYALPALIAIGQARFHHAPPRNPLTRAMRSLVRARTLRVLERIQPPNGGFLEATPLTSFVTMSLAGVGAAHHPVARQGVSFLIESQSADGSWPIDTNLATWVTTLSVNALAPRWNQDGADEEQRSRMRTWLLEQQYRTRHAYTGAAPGGWAWTDLPGGVPDADDTAGALLALHHLNASDHANATDAAARAGLGWLLDLQNRDGGIPTFCRGWGHLPFDRSSADITAHAMRAWLVWLDQMPVSRQARLRRAMRRAVRFLARAQRADGAWIPLWFGNQFDPEDENATYGTARVLPALSELRRRNMFEKDPERRALERMEAKALEWLARRQKEDGSWSGTAGGVSSIEETALAVEALAAAQPDASDPAAAALRRGVDWLVARVETGQWVHPAPIGFYFAKLWYYEELYPLIFTVGALRRASRPPLTPRSADE